MGTWKALETSTPIWVSSIPKRHVAKADLAHRIIDIIEARKLTQVQAGKVLGVDQPKVSALKRGRLTDFSIERLVGFLLLLGHDV